MFHTTFRRMVPKWSVFVLLKVFEEDVAKHRLAIAAEKERLENLPPSQDEWVVSLFNIDDSVSVYVNDLRVISVIYPVAAK